MSTGAKKDSTGDVTRHVSPDLLCFRIGTRGENMDVTTKEYTLLFNTITETIQRLESIKASLSFAQQRAEELVKQGRIK